MVEPWFGKVYGSSSCLEPKGKKKSEFMKIGKPFAKSLIKAQKKSMGDPQGICYFCDEMVND